MQYNGLKFIWGTQKMTEGAVTGALSELGDNPFDVTQWRHLKERNTRTLCSQLTTSNSLVSTQPVNRSEHHREAH